VTVAAVLRGVDRAAFAVSLARRLRRAGVPVAMTRAETFARALAACPPRDRRRLYWLARTTLVDDHHHLAAFDRVFAALFDDAALPVDPAARRAGVAPPEPPGAVNVRVPAGSAPDEDGGGVPWATLPTVVGPADPATSGELMVPEPVPSHLEHLADVPFDRLDPHEAAQVGRWLEGALVGWPTRRRRRRRPHHGGDRPALRATLAAARRTGFEPVRLVLDRPTRQQRRVVVVCDLSRSMQALATVGLHLMRAVARQPGGEAFAFATGVTRLTPALRLRSVDEAAARAEALATDRFGGTRIAHALDQILRSHHGDAVRGAVVVVVSDGWDSDPPEAMGRVMARLRRRAHLVVWLNPRAGAPGYQPLVGSLAAALPHCDAHLPAGTVGNLVDALRWVAAARR
jgi:uncharacterized protein with von Willebrand factor type A (vWA) domain